MDQCISQQVLMGNSQDRVERSHHLLRTAGEGRHETVGRKEEVKGRKNYSNTALSWMPEGKKKRGRPKMT